MTEAFVFGFVQVKEDLLFIGKAKENKIIDFYVFDRKNHSKVGNIYRGRVLNKINGLNAFFVDIGENKNGFFQCDDFLFSSIKESDEMILQVNYDGNESKGPRLTEKYELKGRYFIITPSNSNFRASKKFKDTRKKEKLKEKYEAISKNIGFVIRSKAEKADEKDLDNEFKELVSLANNLEKEKNFTPTPKLLYKYEFIDEYLDFEDCEEVSTNDTFIKDKLETLNKSTLIKLNKNFSIKNSSLFGDLKKYFTRKVVLENGIELVFDKTEAFNVIDINSNGFLIHEKGITKKDANINCISELIKQIHIRNLYGIILVDFISYLDKEREEELLNIFKAESKKYKNPINIIGFTKLGILELTRNKKVNNLSLVDLNINIF